MVTNEKAVIRFGTDGWRAKIAEDFTFSNVRKVAWALASYINGEAPQAVVFVGFDRRFGSKDFAKEAAQVLAGMGVSVRLASDVLPTPAFSYLAKKHKGYALVVTASHNPPADNGLKLKIPQGASAPQNVTSRIEELTLQAPEVFTMNRCLPDEKLRAEYLTYLKDLARPLLKAKGRFKIVVDCFHGSGSGLLESVLGNKHVISLRTGVDPYFGGIAPEPVEKNLKSLKKAVRQNKALLGVALDGDADRIAIVDDEGNYLAPTTVFALYAYYYALVLKKSGEIVQGVSLGYLGERIANKANLPFHWVSVGFKNVAERMASHDVLIGGEESGGYALGSLLPDRDGIVNAILMARLLTHMKTAPRALVATIFKELGASHFERFDFHIDKPVDKVEFTSLCEDQLLGKLKARDFLVSNSLTIDGLKLFFTDGSWLLLRPSGTEALIRIYAETSTKRQTRALIDVASDWIESQFSKKSS